MTLKTQRPKAAHHANDHSEIVNNKGGVDVTPHGKNTSTHKLVSFKRDSRPLQPELKTNQFRENWSYIPNALPGSGIPPPSVYYEASQKQPAQHFVSLLLNNISDRPSSKQVGSDGTEFHFEMFSDAKKDNGGKVPTQCF